MQLRTFIALEIPDAHKQAICDYITRWSKLYRIGINWVKPENLHLTLLFIGETNQGDIPAIKEAVFRLALEEIAFSLQTLGFELFPAREPRLLWVKLFTADKAIYNFAKKLNRAVLDIGYETEPKPLKLHVTAARLKSAQPAWLEQEFLASALPVEPLNYDTITLYQSILKPEGPTYIPLQQFEIIRKAI